MNDTDFVAAIFAAAELSRYGRTPVLTIDVYAEAFKRAEIFIEFAKNRKK